jgi:hypothetical protein
MTDVSGRRDDCSCSTRVPSGFAAYTTCSGLKRANAIRPVGPQAFAGAGSATQTRVSVAVDITPPALSHVAMASLRRSARGPRNPCHEAGET